MPGDDCGKIEAKIREDLLEKFPFTLLSKDQRKALEDLLPKDLFEGEVCLEADDHLEDCHHDKVCCKLTNIHASLEGMGDVIKFDFTVAGVGIAIDVKLIPKLESIDEAKNSCPLICEDGEIAAKLILRVEGTLKIGTATSAVGRNFKIKEGAKKKCKSPKK